MRKIDLIVIHCSATRENRPFPVTSLIACHNSRFGFTGYHYYIERDAKYIRPATRTSPAPTPATTTSTASASATRAVSTPRAVPRTPAPQRRKPLCTPCSSRYASITPRQSSSVTATSPTSTRLRLSEGRAMLASTLPSVSRLDQRSRTAPASMPRSIRIFRFLLPQPRGCAPPHGGTSSFSLYTQNFPFSFGYLPKIY